MGYSCTKAAHRTLECIKAVNGADLDASNEIRLNGRLVFFEHDEEQPDGAIVGRLFDLQGKLNPRRFRINADGSIHAFPGIRRTQADYIQRLAKSDFRCTHNVI